MPALDASFTHLASVPVHYDRLDPPSGYGSKGVPRNNRCRKKLKDTLDACFVELFNLWNKPRPDIILTAGTVGNETNDAHGQGFAFDLDGFWWGETRFMMDEYPKDRRLYIGINAHLFTYFSQVLSYHYPNHRDHFHIDFNFSYTFRPASNAQTFFLQSALRYVFGRDIGKTGPEKDGVDGIFGSATKPVVTSVLDEIGLGGQGGLTVASVWKAFLLECRKRSFQ